MEYQQPYKGPQPQKPEDFQGGNIWATASVKVCKKRGADITVDESVWSLAYTDGTSIEITGSKTDQVGKGVGRFIQDREDFQLVRRARAWLDVLRERGANSPTDPLFRSLTVKGGLRSYPEDRKRGKRMRPGSLNERFQLLAKRARVPYIDGQRVRSHS